MEIKFIQQQFLIQDNIAFNISTNKYTNDNIKKFNPTSSSLHFEYSPSLNFVEPVIVDVGISNLPGQPKI